MLHLGSLDTVTVPSFLGTILLLGSAEKEFVRIHIEVAVHSARLTIRLELSRTQYSSCNQGDEGHVNYQFS